MDKVFIRCSWMSLLRNDEYPMLVEQICTVMDRIDKDALQDPYVENLAAKVKSHLRSLEKIKVRTSKHPLTAVLKDMAWQRRQTLLSLRGQVKALLRSPIDEQKEAAGILMSWLGKHGKRLIYNGYMAQTRRVDELLNEADSDTAILEAIATLSLLPLMEALRKINTSFHTTFLKRNAERAQAEEVDCRAIRKAANADLKLLLCALALKTATDKTGIYTAPAAAIKELLVYYRKRLAFRKGMRATTDRKKEDLAPIINIDIGSK
ncbi:MAG: DUF6261 family protein [Dysgonamonadaceae bacterium]